MDRKSILKRHSYNKEHYVQEDSERNEQEKTQEFKIIQDVDEQRQKILDELLLILQRHEHVLSNIECACRNTIRKFAEHDSEIEMGYYSEAFFIEKKRCIKIFEKYLSKILESFDGFMQTLRRLDLSKSRYPIVESHCENQLKLCKKSADTCINWHRLLLQEEFNHKVKRPVFFYEPDKKRNK